MIWMHIQGKSEGEVSEDCRADERAKVLPNFVTFRNR